MADQWSYSEEDCSETSPTPASHGSKNVNFAELYEMVDNYNYKPTCKKLVKNRQVKKISQEMVQENLSLNTRRRTRLRKILKEVFQEIQVLNWRQPSMFLTSRVR